MLDDILQGFLQDAVETQGEVWRQHFRDVLDVQNVNLYTLPTRDNSSAERRRRRFPARGSSSLGE